MKRARKNPSRIVFHESKDKRILEAAKIMQEKGIAIPIFLGKPNKKFETVDDKDTTLLNRYAKAMYKIRKEKGWSLQLCKQKLKDPNYFATMMVNLGDADAMIAGSTQPTASTLRPALQIIKTVSRKKASSAFLMIGKRPMLFADCAFQIDPDAKDLAQIARDSADTMKSLGIKPKVALLSFSTKGSARHILVDKVINAKKLLSKAKFLVDGELQLDAAIIPRIAKAKDPEGRIKGQANVLIFPDLQAGNIAYKIAQHIGGMEAIGPIVQGLAKPVHDLSRGCTVEEIVHLAAITSCQK